MAPAATLHATARLQTFVFTASARGQHHQLDQRLSRHHAKQNQRIYATPIRMNVKTSDQTEGSAAAAPICTPYNANLYCPPIFTRRSNRASPLASVMLPRSRASPAQMPAQPGAHALPAHRRAVSGTFVGPFPAAKPLSSSRCGGSPRRRTRRPRPAPPADGIRAARTQVRNAGLHI